MVLNSKGQYLSAEQMLLFSLGVIITISVYLSFSTIHKNVGKFAAKDNLREVGNFITSGISRVYTIAKGPDPETDYVNLTLKIPKRISEEEYKVKVGGGKLLVMQGAKTEEVLLENEGNVTISGMIHSGGGRLYVTYSKGNITLER